MGANMYVLFLLLASLYLEQLAVGMNPGLEIIRSGFV